MTKFIALCGRRKNGKDRTADALMGLLSGWKRIAYADAMKDMLSKLDGIPRWELDDCIQKEKHRARLIQFAEAERAIDPDIFVNHLIAKVEFERWEKVIITDLRRPPELESMLNRGNHATILKVFADGPTRTRRGVVYDKSIDESDTETFMDRPDQYFYAIGGAVVYNSDGNCLSGQLKLLSKCFHW